MTAIVFGSKEAQAILDDNNKLLVEAELRRELEEKRKEIADRIQRKHGVTLAGRVEYLHLMITRLEIEAEELYAEALAKENEIEEYEEELEELEYYV